MTVNINRITSTFIFPKSGSNLFFVKHDYQMSPFPDRFNKLDRDPETVGTYYDRGIRVTPQMDAYMRHILKLFCPNLSDADFEKNYHSLMADGTRSGAFCNFAGIDSPDWSWEELICGGATVEAVTGKVVRMGGGDWIECHALNASHVPPLPATIADVDMTRHFKPTTFTHERLADGTYRVWSFPQFYDKGVVPLWSKSDTLFIPADRLMRVSVIQNPFNPAFIP